MIETYYQMASLLGIIGGAAIKALAFTGSNSLFSMLSDLGAEKRERHDLVGEEEQKLYHEWNQKRANRLDFINKSLRKEQ